MSFLHNLAPRRAVLWAAFAALLAAALPARAADSVTVFAAASMKDAVEDAIADWRGADASRPEVVVSFASSSVLARQIEAGAGADIFISANPDWMDWLAERDAIAPDTRRDIARNTIVIARLGDTGFDSAAAALDGVERIAMGDPEHVPAGKYGRQALESAGLWADVQPKAVFGENVRVALTLAERGEADAAIVYGSDLVISETLKAAYVFPADGHDPIVYPAALTAGANDAALGFLDFLSGADGQAILARFGFSSAGP